ncbi:MAG: PQQ-binding-like beta-propeller repeat protein [Planctomycetaceae bacterium]|nr:PQQ-binding-like beta-propeller repeat protein [Planctomycetaceae bacterium]
MRPKLYALVAMMLSVVLSSLDAQENWPRFRGPNGSGISGIETIPTEWNQGNFHWKFDLPGEGNSSPVVWDRQVFVTSADAEGGKRYLYALDVATGRQNWKHEFPFTKYKRHKNNSFASSTPAVDELYVYTIWRSAEGSSVVALTHSGETSWTYDLGPWTQGQGGASSPIAYREWIFIANDHREGSALLALDRKTGKEIWRIPREGKRACFTTPCVYSPPNGSPEIIFTHCYEGIIGVDPATGLQKWHIDVFGRHSQRAVGSPVIYEELVIGSSGAAGGKRNVVAVRPLTETKTEEKNILSAEEEYRVFKSSPHVPTPIVYQNRLYLWEDKGVVSAHNARTGELIWRLRVGGTYFASPIVVNDRLFNLDVTGKVFVISLKGEPEVLAENQMPEGGKATLAAAAGMLFVRTDSALYAIGESLQ